MNTKALIVLLSLAVLFQVFFAGTLLAGSPPQISLKAEKSFYNDMKSKEASIKAKMRLRNGKTCGELSRAIKEYEQGVWMLSKMIVDLKQQIKELQKQLQTDLIRDKLKLRLYLFKEWKKILKESKEQLSTLKQTATRKGCHANLINPCKTQPNGQLRCS